ncbi:SH3 domain-containing protein [Staphylococcus pseudintermedius]|nr:CHAP domain-containing protein [Staphylococcus pseudintermedius]EGQ2849310.1 CHAP domain-containing protein [Staphylococcus pseudintermedius]EGQ3041226.1 CHAP domain-containing protein [Staphylococcus pseudintermedius]EGQ3475138.1 CHAP domain-containing protein [Staphylococcus pseudintermedius]EGQ4015971.1 CHAP domain-containing protein [Staphylococcus pseudintermedius]
MKKGSKTFKNSLKIGIGTVLVLGGVNYTNSININNVNFKNLSKKTVTTFENLKPLNIFEKQNAYADTITTNTWSQEDATKYIQNHIGVGVDFDGYYGYQCMDLAVDYMFKLSNGNVRLFGNAYQAKNNSLGNYAKVYPNATNFLPEVGDIVVWYPKSWNANYGHIGIVKEANLNQFTSLEQNIIGNLTYGEVGRLATHNYNDVAYFIRPNFSNKSHQPNASYSDTQLNPQAIVSDWMKTRSGITYRHENGQYTVTRKEGAAVYGEPNNDGKQLANFKPNTTLNYDYKYVNDGYVWVGFEKNNKRYYVQTGYSDGKIGYKIGSEPFGAFTKVNFGETSYSDTPYNSNAVTSEWSKTKSGIIMRYENGRFKVTKDNGVAIYSEPNNDGKQFDTLKKNQYLIYDYKYINDGYVWVGFEKNGKRYYAQVGYSDGKYGYKPYTHPFGQFY